MSQDGLWVCWQYITGLQLFNLSSNYWLSFRRLASSFKNYLLFYKFKLAPLVLACVLKSLVYLLFNVFVFGMILCEPMISL